MNNESGISNNNIQENDIISLAKNGNKNAINSIMLKYGETVNIKANKYYIKWRRKKNDLVQEGYIGLYKAIRSFNPKEENSFKNFANLCIERQMITAVKGSNRQKHIPLNSLYH